MSLHDHEAFLDVIFAVSNSAAIFIHLIQQVEGFGGILFPVLKYIWYLLIA